MVPPFFLRVACHMITGQVQMLRRAHIPRNSLVSKSFAAAQIFDRGKTVAF